MKTKLLLFLIQQIISRLRPDMVRSVADSILDAIESAVEQSPNSIDDAAILPLCGMIRVTFDIPDDGRDDSPGPDVNL